MRRKYLATAAILLSSALGLNALQAQSQMAAHKFGTLLNLIDQAYVDEVEANELVETAIVEMLEELDPHSVYITKDEVQKMNEPLVGNFDGIGIQFNIYKDTIIVVSPISGGPSEKLGIMAGDKIVNIDDSLVAGIGIKNADVTGKLRGPKGSKVKVSIYRNGVSELMDFDIVRDKIPIYSVDAAYMVDSKTGYIKIARFAANTVDEFNEGLDSLKKQGLKNLIVDLRGNSGGYLKTAEVLSDMFLDGDKLIVYTEGRSQPRFEMKATPKGTFQKGKLIILIDEGSASASEIVSGAVQDWDRGLIVGRRSFGKGLVQKPYTLPDGSMVRLTISRYYTPSGRSIQKPYEEGSEAYRQEAAERYEHGEYFFADSINLPDSLQYETKTLGRTVYGGGGIMPDVFVALDTTYNSKSYRNLLRKNVFNSFTLEHMNANRESLKLNYPTASRFAEQYELSSDLFNEFLAFAEENGASVSTEDLEKSSPFIQNLLKAYFARALYNSSAFYLVYNQTDKTMNKALEMMYDSTFDNLKLSVK